MKSKIIVSIALLSGVMIFSSGCKKWLDINKDPTVATDVPPNMLLSSAEVSIASGIGTYMQVNGELWAQHWTQAPASSQYKIYEQYSPNASDYDRPWATLYSDALMDLEVLQQKARATNAKDYQAVALLLKAYAFQVVTDAWGDVPFSEALKGRPTDGGIVSPKYDAQEMVYTGINRMIDTARDMINELQTANVTGDLMYGGDLGLWLKFANTLQLKVYLRLSEKSPGVAQAGIAKVYNDPSGFIEEGEDAQISFTSTPGNQNPLFSEIVGLGRTQNLVASSTVVDSMNANNDYRAYALFTYISSTGLVTGIPQGAYDLPASTAVSIPMAYTGARAQDDNSGTAPVRFISSYESYFLQAEAIARGWAAGDDEALFYQGLTANFHALDADPDGGSFFENLFGVTADSALNVYLLGDPSVGAPPAYWGMYPTGGTVQEKVRHIITQKWFCMTGTQGFEAWTEWRRTGYPDFFTISANSIIGSKFPNRFLYPNVELTRNQQFPGQPVITEKVWWDAN